MFIENCEIFNFADGNTLHSFGIEISSILDNLKLDGKLIIKLFRINSLKANPRTFQFIILVYEVTFNKPINNLFCNAN